MTLEITTPAVLFPTVSLLLLAYTNRFLALTAIVRQMDSSGEVEHEFYQVKNLRKRLNYIKRMQYFGVSSLLMCAISMLFLFFQMDFIGKISFGISLIVIFAYIAVVNYAKIMVLKNNIPANIAMWVPNTILLILCVYFSIKKYRRN